MKNVSLESSPNAKFAIVRQKGEFLQLHFRLHNHTQQAKERKTLTESIKFCVDDFSTGKTIFETKVSFDESCFLNLINKPGNENKRMQCFLDMASKLMKPLELPKK